MKDADDKGASGSAEVRSVARVVSAVAEGVTAAADSVAATETSAFDAPEIGSADTVVAADAVPSADASVSDATDAAVSAADPFAATDTPVSGWSRNRLRRSCRH